MAELRLAELEEVLVEAGSSGPGAGAGDASPAGAPVAAPRDGLSSRLTRPGRRVARPARAVRPSLGTV